MMDVSQTAALSAVTPPDGLANLLTNLPDETVQHGLLSNVQLEFLEYAPGYTAPFPFLLIPLLTASWWL